MTISLHQDVQAEAYDFPAHFFEPRTWQVAPRRPPSPSGAAPTFAPREPAADHRRRGRPLLRRRGAAAELAHALGIPVGETSAGKGALPEGELALGGLGVTGTRAANALAAEADLVIGRDAPDRPHHRFALALPAPGRSVRRLNVARGRRQARGRAARRRRASSRSGSQRPPSAIRLAPPERWRGRALAKRRWERELDPTSRRAPASAFARARPSRGQRVSAARATGSWSPPAPRTSMSTRCGTRGRRHAASWRSASPAWATRSRPRSACAWRRGAGEVYALIGDGTYLMGTPRARDRRQEGLKLTVLLVDNHGYQSIHGLQRGRTGRSFGLEFRGRSADGPLGRAVPRDRLREQCSEPRLCCVRGADA